MTRVREFLGHEYKVSRGLMLYFVTVAVAVQLLWPAFANSWTGSFIVIGASFAVAVSWKVSRLLRDKARSARA